MLSWYAVNPKIGITSLSVTKLANEQGGFIKYNIESAIDEIENTETEVQLRYKFTLLSNPTNTKISIEGVTTIYGNQTEVSNFFVPDERKIPRVVNNIYQEIFPLFYILAKSVQIPCPAYKLSEISASDHLELGASPENLQAKAEPAISVERLEGPQTVDAEEISAEQAPLQEQVIEQRSM